MTASRPDNEAIFHAALDISDPDHRRDYVHEACGGDEARIAHIEALLAAADGPDSLLDRPAAGSPVATTDQPTTEGAGTVIGPYKLIEPIGEGGMGSVWMAQQTAPVKRLVAVKLIKAGMDTRQVIARFEAERQALALMDHPNIARVLDGGTTSGGRPYFVMDLVKGVPITRYCDEHHLTPRQRLELFIPICQAVQHAHQKGIIHRDLKPSNVLVALYDGKPVPKIIDFGVAKAAGQQLTDKTLVTGFGAIVGTLEYMSPEQAEVNQLDIDTRSDIYSLGVLLYELLAGSPPFSRKELEKAGMLEMLRVIREQEPSKPSTKLSSSDALPTLSANRGTEPAKLTKQVRGELDWIVMKSLEKDRNRRYETANGFAMDVQRYLADEPVQACPPSAGYRLRKFARRNRTALAIAGMILLFIAVLGGGGGWVIRDREAREEAVARERQERAQRLTARVEQILDDVDRLEQEQKWPEAQAAVERAEAVAGGEAGDALRQRLADVRHDLELIAELDRLRQERGAIAEGKVKNAEAVRRYAEAFRAYGLDVEALPAEEVAARLQGKPALAVAIAATLDDWVAAWSNPGEAESSWKRLVAVARGLDHDPLRDQLRAGWGQPFQPERWAERQAELRRLAESIDVKAQRPATLQALARTLNSVQLGDDAVRILRDGQQAYPADFWLNYELGNQLFYTRNNPAASLRYFSAAVSLRPDSYTAHNSLAWAFLLLQKWDEASACYRKVIELNPKKAYAHLYLGFALVSQRKLDEASAAYRQAIALVPKDGNAHYFLGEVLHEQGKLDEASACYRKAIELDPHFAVAHAVLGRVLRDQGKWDEAIASLQKAIELNPGSAQARDWLGNVLHEQKKWDEAIASYRKAIAVDPRYARAHVNLGIALREQGKWDEAIASYRKAIALEPRNAWAHDQLGVALGDHKQDYDEAIAEFRQVLELAPKYAWGHYHLGIALGNQGKLDEAIACYRKAIALDPKPLPGVHSSLADACARLGRWDEALAPMDKAAELAPDDHWRLYLAALLHLQVGDRAGYRRICREMLERFGDTKDPVVADRSAKLCLLAPEAVADLDRVLKIADRAVTGTEKHSLYRWFLPCKALAEYRAGRHAEAVQWLERFAPKASGWEIDATAFAVLALAQHHRGRGEQALAALDRAERMVAAKLPDPAAGRPFGDSWHDWLRCQVLAREAEELLKPDDARIHFYRGLRRRGQQKWPEAETEYRQAIRLRPNWYEAHYQLAVAIEEQGRQKDAQAAFREALPLKPRQPDGPPRAILPTDSSDLKTWVVKDQQVHQLDESSEHMVLFGDPNWTDYDFEAEVEIIAGGSELGLIFRATSRDDYVYALVGGWGNTCHGVLSHKGGEWDGCVRVKGQSKKGCWYRLRVEARGDRIKMFLDGKQLTTFESDQHLRGCVGLITKGAHARFRNLKVTDATGKVLLEGVQDVLPKPKD